MEEAEAQFSHLLELALEGEEIIIARHGVPAVMLVPARQQRLPLGAGRAETDIKSDDWWRAMTDEEADAFLSGKD